jgi:hypothetical protein
MDINWMGYVKKDVRDLIGVIWEFGLYRAVSTFV